jgi:hypothetical protein
MNDFHKQFSDMMKQIDRDFNKINIRTDKIFEQTMGNAEELLRKARERVDQHKFEKKDFEINLKLKNDIRNLQVIKNTLIFTLIIALFLFSLITFSAVMNVERNDSNSLTPKNQIEKPLKSEAPKEKKL